MFVYVPIEHILAPRSYVLTLAFCSANIIPHTVQHVFPPIAVVRIRVSYVCDCYFIFCSAVSVGWRRIPHCLPNPK